LPETLHIPTLEAAVEEIKSRRHDAMIQKENIQAELTRAESDVTLVEARIQKDDERLTHTSSAKDAQGLEHELESLRKRRSDLEDIELAIMERLEQADSVLTGLIAELATADEALTDARAQYTAQSAALEAETATQRATRESIVAILPDDLYALYERQRERYGVGASHLRGGVSSASGVALTESDLQDVRRAAPEEVVMCPDSNAILVRTAESGL
jgi:predicted  nucleic acid-binding Zn-ribbon protein